MMNRTETDRTTTIMAGYLADAKEQLASLQAMIDKCDGKDIQAIAVTALAAENTAKAVRKVYEIRLEYGLA